MASDLTFVQFVLDQLEPNLAATHKKMFGEYGLFSGGKMWGVICDNRLFVKPTEGGRAHIGAVVEAPPYPGARPAFVIEAELDDAAWLSELVRVTVGELPETGAARRARPPAGRGSPIRRKPR
jgi:TfoX/Sxy family transcriptional regulator of competence genes